MEIAPSALAPRNSLARGWPDAAAIAASGICLVHCLVVPMILVLAPAMAVYFAIPEAFHRVVVMLAIPTSALALGSSFSRHRAVVPIALVIPGLALLVCGAFFAPGETSETALTVLGSICVAAGHAMNWRSVRHARHQYEPD